MTRLTRIGFVVLPTPPDAASNTASSATTMVDWFPELLKIPSPVFTARMPCVEMFLRKKSSSEPTKTAVAAVTINLPVADISTSSRCAISMAERGAGDSVGFNTTCEMVAARPNSEINVPFCLSRIVFVLTERISQTELSGVALRDLLTTLRYRPAWYPSAIQLPPSLRVMVSPETRSGTNAKLEVTFFPAR